MSFSRKRIDRDTDRDKHELQLLRKYKRQLESTKHSLTKEEQARLQFLESMTLLGRIKNFFKGPQPACFSCSHNITSITEVEK